VAARLGEVSVETARRIQTDFCRDSISALVGRGGGMIVGSAASCREGLGNFEMVVPKVRGTFGGEKCAKNQLAAEQRYFGGAL